MVNEVPLLHILLHLGILKKAKSRYVQRFTIIFLKQRTQSDNINQESTESIFRKQRRAEMDTEKREQIDRYLQTHGNGFQKPLAVPFWLCQAKWEAVWMLWQKKALCSCKHFSYVYIFFVVRLQKKSFTVILSCEEYSPKKLQKLGQRGWKHN